MIVIVLYKEKERGKAVLFSFLVIPHSSDCTLIAFLALHFLFFFREGIASHLFFATLLINFLFAPNYDHRYQSLIASISSFQFVSNC